MDNESGYPPRTPIVQELLQEALATDNEGLIVGGFCKVLCAIRNVFSSTIDMDTKLWDVEESRFLWKKVEQTFRNMTDVPEKCNDQKMFILFLDEANNLGGLSTKVSDDKWRAFKLFRRALKAYTGVFCVMLGTNSKLSNFQPIRQKDPSNRALTQDLFRPFIIGGTRDIHVKSPILERDASLVELFRLGRPLWNSYVTPESLGAVVKFAEEKLLGGLQQPVYTDAETLAIASVRLCLNVGPATELAHELVAGYMATLFAVDTSRQLLLTAYPPEPVLCEAAARLWNTAFASESRGRGGGIYWQTAILPTLVHLKHGTTSLGYTGELVARFLLLLAVDRVKQASDAHYFSDKVPLSAFLAELANLPLFGDSGIIQNLETSRSAPFADANVRFTHFILLETSPTMSTLQLLRSRCSAAVMPAGHRGANIAIPLRLSDGTLSCILVQVKNRESDFGIPAAAERLLPMRVFDREVSNLADLPATVGILMQLGSKKNQVEFLRAPTRSSESLRKPRVEHPRPLVLYGLSDSVYPCLRGTSETTMRLLTILLRTPLNFNGWSEAGHEWQTALTMNLMPNYDKVVKSETEDVDMGDGSDE
jgi:hypothetical protein